VVWLSVQVMGAVLLTVLWTVAGTTLDARQSRRLFPLCTGAAIAGAFLGTLSSGPLAAAVGVSGLLMVAAVLLAVGALLAARILGSGSSRAARPAGTFAQELTAGARDVGHSPLMRLVAVAYVLFAVLLFSVTFPFQSALQASTNSAVELATVLGLLSAAITGTAFLIAVLGANRAYARIGVAGAALVLPVVYVIGFGTWMVSFGIVTALGFRFAQQVTQRGLSNAAWSAMFNVVPIERRPQVLAFMDGVPGQLGTSLSGVLLLVVGAWFAPSEVFLLGLVAAFACLLVVVGIRRRYGEALLTSLHAGLGEQVLSAGPGHLPLTYDPQVLDQLRVAAVDPKPSVRRLALELLGQLGGADAADALGRGLDDGDPSVRAAAIRALTNCHDDWTADGPPGIQDSRSRSDPDPKVRSALAIGLARHQRPDAAEELVVGLMGGPGEAERIYGLRAIANGPIRVDAAQVASWAVDASPAIRAAALGALVVTGDRVRGRDCMLAALDDRSGSVRAAAAAGLRQLPGSGTHVVAVLADGSPRAQEAALMALDGADGGQHAVVRDWAVRQADRAGEYDRLRLALGPAVRDGVSAGPGAPAIGDRDHAGLPELRFLVAILDVRRQQVVDRLLSAAVVLGSPESAGTIRRALRSTDRDARAQAIEAIDTIGDRRLGSAIVRLIEAEQAGGDLHPDQALDALGEDSDPWLRAIAVRAQAARLASRWERIQARVAGDPEPLVRNAINSMQRGGPTMPDTERTLDDIDRMLLLRGVPRFAALSPEDLQRLAATASERFVPTGEALVREGEPGDELIVIVAGDVRVERADGTGVRFLRRYEAGDHIGELAVLTERPRAATVIAEHDVRGLVVSGAGLRAILQERPLAAMAMLATLASRIAAQ